MTRGFGDASAVQSLISSLAPSYGIPPSLALAVANQESSFNPNAVSPAGAMGIMQLMPGTASDLGVTDAFDPTQNVQGGLSYLQQMYQRFGNWTQALEAYNAGPDGNLAGSSGYAASVLAAAGPLDDSSTASDSLASDVSSGLDLSALSSDLGGVSMVTVAAVAAAALLMVWISA